MPGRPSSFPHRRPAGICPVPGHIHFPVSPHGLKPTLWVTLPETAEPLPRRTDLSQINQTGPLHSANSCPSCCHQQHKGLPWRSIRTGYEPDTNRIRTGFGPDSDQIRTRFGPDSDQIRTGPAAIYVPLPIGMGKAGNGENSQKSVFPAPEFLDLRIGVRLESWLPKKGILDYHRWY